MRLYFDTEISIGETKVIPKVKLPQLIRTIFLKSWRSDIDSCSPLLFLKVEATCILAIGFLNDQNCRKEKLQMKAPSVKFTIAHLHKLPFCGVHKYFIILWVGSVLYVSYLHFNDYSTNSTNLQSFFNVRLIKKWVVLHGLKLWKLNSFLEPFRWRTIEFIREFWSVRLKILHLCTSQTIGQFWAQCTVWSKRKAFLRFDNFI